MDYSGQILNTFKQNWDKLTWEKQRHFAYRASLISDDLFWKEELNKKISETKIKLRSLIRIDQKDKKLYGFNNNRLLDPKKPNDEGKVEIYKEFPEIIYWGDYFNHCRYLFIDKYYEIDYQFNDLDKADLLALIYNKKIGMKVPVWVVECITDLRWLMNDNRTAYVKDLYNQFFVESADSASQWNRYYFLTHVVIGESRYYTKKIFVSNWALELLNTEFEKNMENLSIDLVSEIGLCLMIGGCLSEERLRLIELKVERNFDKDDQLIHESSKYDINLLEHRNIITAMVLKGL